MQRDDRDTVHKSARTHALEHVLAALLAPRAVREDLITLAAFIGELEHIALSVSEPLIGEIRLQWWREWLEDATPDSRSGNPVADAMAQVIARHDLSKREILPLINAQSPNLYDTPVGSQQEFLSQLADAQGTPFKLKARILKRDASERLDDVARCAGQAYGIARYLTNLRAYAKNGRWPLPHAGPDGSANTNLVHRRDLADARRTSSLYAGQLARSKLNEVRKLRDDNPSTTIHVVLPAALVEPYLAALENIKGDPLVANVDISPLARRWNLWRASKTGRL